MVEIGFNLGDFSICSSRPVYFYGAILILVVDVEICGAGICTIL
jgi:hypothetical protein